MSIGCDEVKTHVDATVVKRVEIPLDLQLFLQVVLELGVDVIDDGLETVFFIHLVTITHRVAQSELQKQQQKHLWLMQ